MNRKAQGALMMGLIGVFIFAIVGTAILPTLADQINDAQTATITVLNESQTITNATLTFVTLTNVPITGSSPTAVRNWTNAAITEQATAPGWQLISATTGNISVNYTGIDIGAATQPVFFDYTFTGNSNLTTTDRALLDLWPTFIIIGGLLAILASVGLT